MASIAFNLSTLIKSTATVELRSGISTATNFSGGTAGSIPYQSSTGTTAFLGPGTAGQILQSNGTSAPSWASAAYSTATSVQYVANSTSVAALTPAAVWAASAPLTISDAPTITFDLSAGINFIVTATSVVGATRAIANPSNAKPGQTGWIAFTQSPTGSNAVTFGNQWHFSTGTNASLSSTANAIDLIYYTVVTNNYVLTTIAKQWF